MARVNQSCLTADIWFREECCNTIRVRSKGQHNQIRYAREWHGWHRFILDILEILKVKGERKSSSLLSYTNDF